MSDSGTLEKMTITAFKKNDFKGEIGTYQVMINPEKYKRTYQICYNETQPQGAASGSPEFNRAKSDEITMELVFDGTGVVPPPLPGSEPFTGNGIAEQLDEFLGLVFDYNGSIHSPNFLQLVWGELIFDCRLTVLDLTYTLFKPDGTPLRARANATFREYTNKIELEKEENDQSPDMTHVRTVVAGDTLPLMCYDIYGSSVYYPQVAAANNLTDFRQLKIGSQLVFPPLEDAPA